MEDIFREKDLIEQILLLEMKRYYFSGSPSFWEETSPRWSTFFLGGEHAGDIYLIEGRWEAYVYIPASLLIGKGSTEKVQRLICSRKKVKAKEAVEDFYRRLLK